MTALKVIDCSPLDQGDLPSSPEDITSPTPQPATPEWWRGAVIYQIYPLSFGDSNGDGYGDLPGIIQHLEYVALLGVDAIWISPFYKSPFHDLGYDVADHKQVDPRFGTLADFDRLVARAKELGLKVMLDMVWNHTSSEHPWFIESSSSRDNPKADWFIWADAREDGTPPNNWMSIFGASAWTWSAIRGQYYMSHFLKTQPQLNLRNPAVVQELLGIGRFWLDRGVEGLRFDAIDWMFHHPNMQDNPPCPIPPNTLPIKPFQFQQHIYDLLHDDARAFMSEIHKLVAEYPGTVSLGELSSQPGWLRRIGDYTQPTESGLNMAYTLGLMKGKFDAGNFQSLIREQKQALRDGWICWSFANHDVVRPVSRWSSAPQHRAIFARLLMTLLLSLRGSICMYQGEELGLTEAEIAPEFIRDPYGLVFQPRFFGRDGSRTPVPWNAEERHAGFTTANTPWLPIPDEHFDMSVNRQWNNPASVLASWREALAWRKRHPALIYGEINLVETQAPVLAFTRADDTEKLILIFNLSEFETSMSMSLLPAFTPLLDRVHAAVIEDDLVKLSPYGTLIGICG
jgi:alpha-glucosidase